MELKSYYICLLAIFLLPSCNGCKRKQTPESDNKEQKTEFSINISNITFGDNWSKLGQENHILSQAEYDSLKLGTLSFIPPYGDLQYELGGVLINEDNKKLLTVKSVASGEISEYLLGYINNNITDSLLVAYEDNVEYYSATSSTIEGNTINVRTINWDYSGAKEIADTIITEYQITPELTFDEVIEE